MIRKAALLAMLAPWAGPPIAAPGLQPWPVDAGHLVLVKMVDEGGGKWAFEPSTIEAQPGDTVRFLQGDIVPHNVQFKKEPKGAKLGAAAMGPFLVKKGDTYDLVIDARFVPGTYDFVCTPHEMMGMKGTLHVAPGGSSDEASNWIHPRTPSGGMR